MEVTQNLITRFHLDPPLLGGVTLLAILGSVVLYSAADQSTAVLVKQFVRLGIGFVAMISNRYRTMDNMMAFHASVNLVINIKNIEDIGKILGRGITDTELFYRIYKESLKESGRI